MKEKLFEQIEDNIFKLSEDIPPVGNQEQRAGWENHVGGEYEITINKIITQKRGADWICKSDQGFDSGKNETEAIGNHILRLANQDFKFKNNRKYSSEV